MPNLEVAVRTSTTPSFVADAQHRIILWNQACAELLGIRAEEVLGQTCHDVLSGLDVFGNPYCSATCPVRQCMEARRPLRPFQLRVRDGSGRSRTVGCTVLPFACDDRPGCYMYQLYEARPVDVERPAPAPASELSWTAGAPKGSEAGLGALSPREREVLELLAAGYSTEGVAARLRISSVTVRNHIQKILRKLQVRNRLSAVLLLKSSG